MKQNFKRWMLATGTLLLHTQIIFAQQATQVDLTDEKFNLEGWMFMGAGIAICLAGILLFFLNKLFTRTALGDQKNKKAKKHAKQAKKKDKASVKIEKTSIASSKKPAAAQKTLEDKQRHAAEIARQKAEEERRRAAEMARQKAEEERRHAAELARQKAEEEQRRAAEMARQKAEEERRRAAEMARQRAEEEQRRAAEIARQKSEEEQRQAVGAFQLALVEISEQASAKAIRIDLGDERILGRNVQKCDVVIADDPAVSGVHCQFYAFEGKVYVMDLGSTNGTYVNHKKVHHAVVLQKGDLIEIGAKEYRVSWS